MTAAREVSFTQARCGVWPAFHSTALAKAGW